MGGRKVPQTGNRELAGLKVNQIAIGSCTNSSYADLYKVGQILDGKTVSPSVSLGIAPGSREVLQMIASDGTLGDFRRGSASPDKGLS